MSEMTGELWRGKNANILKIETIFLMILLQIFDFILVSDKETVAKTVITQVLFTS